MSTVTHVFFDIGGVLGTNGWDREQRSAAKAKFQLGEEFVGLMLAQSQPFAATIDVATRIAAAGRVRLFTLNNESEALNVYRIERFGLRPVFEAFLSSCWLGIRKPAPLIFERALGIAQVKAEDAMFVDDRERNLLPASAIGMRVHLFDGNARALETALSAAGAL